MDDLSRLFEPTAIGKVAIKNRIAMAAMGCRGLCHPDGTFAQRAIDYYEERAKGGAGLIITGAIKVENELDKHSVTTRPISSLSPHHFAETSGELTEAVHAHGAKIFAQMSVGHGRAGHPGVRLAGRPVSASPTPNYWDPSVTCRELTIEEIEKIIKAFEDTAAIVASSGFDGIEVHAIHEGYLLDQFAVALWNKRTDRYGGDLRGRLTLAIEILRRVKARVGKDFPVIMRFSIKSYVKDWGKGGLPGETFKEMGRDVEEGLEAARILEEAGYDGFDADAGSYDSWYWPHPPQYMPRGSYLDLTQKLKKVVKGPVLVAGRLDIPALAARTLEEGKADMILIARGLLADPYWPAKVQTKRIQEIRPCIACHDGCLGRTRLDRPLSCTVNPATGREKLFEINPAARAKKVLIVGGGPAGMETARVAATRGHKVTLFERSDTLGGHMIEAGVPDFKEDIGRLLNWYKLQLKNLKAGLVLGTKVTPALIDGEKPDVVVVATGANPFEPGLRGASRSSVTNCPDLLMGRKKAGKAVVVVGGGLMGCETALWLVRQGRKVTVIELLPELMKGSLPVPHPNRVMLIDLLAFHKVDVLTNTGVCEIGARGVVAVDKMCRTRDIDCDTVVLALGMKSEDGLYKSLVGKVTQLYAIGDCKEPRRMLEAIWEGNAIGRTI
ncbi:MAG: FAD-dependent oxidoreductase [Chloroflexota bacterium]